MVALAEPWIKDQLNVEILKTCGHLSNRASITDQRGEN